MDLTERILARMKGQLGVTVSHPDIAGSMVVSGASSNPAEFGWENMPEEMRVPDRMVYCCTSDWHADPMFVFADEAIVVDAPADMVVDEMLDMMYEMGSHGAVERLENGEPDEVEEEE